MTEPGDRLRSNGVSIGGLTRLVDACLRISSEPDPGAILQKISDEARQVAQAQYSAVQVFETGTDPGEPVTSGFNPEMGEPAEHPVSLERLLRPVSGSQEAPEAQGAGPWLTVQVRYDEENVARLHVAGREGGEDFTPEDRTLLHMFASLAGAAIARAKAGQRTEFPDFVAHQFRTSILAIRGSVATVLGSPHPMDHRGTRQFLQIIDEHADHMRHMMGNLSDQRDIETGTLSVNPQPADLEDLVKQARETFLRQGGANTVIVRSGPALPNAKLDRDRIFRVLGILLAHVSESSPPSSVIRVSLSGTQADAVVTVEISAQYGEGWEPDDEPEPDNHIRDPARPPVIDTHEPLPTGPAICRAIVEAHGGHLSAHGAGPAPGPRFTLTLPAGDHAESNTDNGPKTSPSPPQGPGSAQARVLAIDPDPVSLTNIQSMLLEAGFTTVATGNPDAIEHLVVTERPHIFLVDLTQTGPGGLEIIQRIGRISEAPVMFILDPNTGPDMDWVFDLGAADCILKPLTQKELEARIRAALRPRRDPVQPDSPEPFVLGELTVDYAERTVNLSGAQVQLTPTEYKVISELSKAAGRTLTHEQLLRGVWGSLYQGDVRVVRTYIKELRQRLGDDFRQPRYIFTETGVGYRMPKSAVQQTPQSDAETFGAAHPLWNRPETHISCPSS